MKVLPFRYLHTYTLSHFSFLTDNKYLLLTAPKMVSAEDVYKAASEGNLAEVLKKCENINNVKDLYGRTALHLAAINGNVEAVHLLVHNNADVNEKSEGGYTPLHFAALIGHLQTAYVLIQYQADEDQSVSAALISVTVQVLLDRSDDLKSLVNAKQETPLRSENEKINIANIMRRIDTLQECGLSIRTLTNERELWSLIFYNDFKAIDVLLLVSNV